MFVVSMLGRMSISVDECRVAHALGPRGRLLAGYLFEFPGRVHRREYLSEKFWEDRRPQQARAAMNTALWRLRKILALDPRGTGGACLSSSGEEIVFRREPWMLIDTHVFDEAVRCALAGCGQETPARASVLEQAAAQYGGSFLDGDDADWVVAERERLHSLYVRCLCDLMRIYSGCHDFESAIAAARRVLAADQFRETVMRSLAILLFLNGQRAQAIEELTRWQSALRTHVGVGVLPETSNLRSALVSGDICSDLDYWRETHLATMSPTAAHYS